MQDSGKEPKLEAKNRKIEEGRKEKTLFRQSLFNYTIFTLTLVSAEK